MLSFSPITLLFLLISAPFYVFAHDALNPSELEMGPLLRYDAPEKATASMILLHGMGGTGTMFIPLEERLHHQERFKHINFVFPTSPIRETPFYVQFGDPLTHSWFNFSSEGQENWIDDDQFWDISDYIQRLVLNETAHGIPLNRIVVGGYSQGGMVALGGLASIHTKVAGWLLFPTEIPQNVTRFDRMLVSVNKKTPVFHGHGLNDTMIHFPESIRTANFYKKLGFNYRLHLYPGMNHEIDWEPNLEDVEAWIQKIIPKKWHR